MINFLHIYSRPYTILMQEITISKNHDIPLGTEPTVPATRPSPTRDVSDLVVQYHCGRQSGVHISTPIPKEEIIFVRKNHCQRIPFIKIIFIELYLFLC